jgi:hypothetical protein
VAGSVPSTDAIDARLDALAKQRFRASFHLQGRERALVELRGLRAIRSHADDLIATRVAPANPPRDGKQTPYRNHPVFVAQHATATCCRGCLERNHQIPRGRELTADERRYATDLIMRWIEREVPDAPQ